MENKSLSSESNDSNNQLPEIAQKVESASDAYKNAEKFIKENDGFGWQQFVKQIRGDTSQRLTEVEFGSGTAKTRRQGAAI